MCALEMAISIRVSVGTWKITLIQCLESCLGVRTPEFTPGVPCCLGQLIFPCLTFTNNNQETNPSFPLRLIHEKDNERREVLSSVVGMPHT